jgi:chorismate mutase
MDEQDIKIEELKDEISDIDIKIVLLLNQRADFSTELNNLKKELDIPYDRLEDMELMENLEEISNYNNMIDTIYPSILKYCRSLYE